MMALIQWPASREDHRSVANLRRTIMTWETPQAVELRFGMEITMYVSNR